MGVPTVRILRVLGQNVIWMWASWRSIEYTIRGKVVASPKSELWQVLWVWICPWLFLAPKCSNYAITNLLFGLCRPVWVNKLLVNLPSPILELQHAPLPPPKVLWAKEHAPTPYSSVVFALDSHLSLLRSLGVRHTRTQVFVTFSDVNPSTHTNHII